ncbi:hypothetical protein C8Q76DRAFT_146930 [Earliella scabrosa]|nr:hypothetical protein C8Q76DRAFT_146930 [Earliella scabrosa]
MNITIAGFVPCAFLGWPGYSLGFTCFLGSGGCFCILVQELHRSAHRTRMHALFWLRQRLSMTLWGVHCILVHRHAIGTS